MRVVEGRKIGTGMKVAICVSRFNEIITERLVQGAADLLWQHGVERDDVTVYRCPGTFELGPLVQRVARTGQFDAVVALGAVLRGGTPHFEYVASACTQAISKVAMEADCAVTFGVLTCDTLEQAIDRAGAKVGNKGAEAALAAIEQASLFRAVQARGSEA